MKLADGPVSSGGNRPVISLIVAMDRAGVIGRDGALPWHLPADLKRFRAITMGKPIVMGRRTYESIGRALPGRRNVVLSAREGYEAQGCDTFTSIEAALDALADAAEIMIIGGAALYRTMLPLADRLYLTDVDAEVDGDVAFPDFDRDAWRCVEEIEHAADDAHAHAFSFRVFERISANAAPAR